MKNDSGKISPFLVKVVVFFGLVALVFVGVASYKEISKKKQIQSEIEKLKVEAEQISQENALTQEKIAYLESRDYQEKEAKDKLNLQNPGENVVVVKPSVVSDKKEETTIETAAPQQLPETSNLSKWWNYFFK